MRIILFLLFITAANFGWGQVSLTTIGTPYTQDFNTLVNTGTSSVLPTGWSLNESGTGANLTYTSGTGSSATGDTYSFGTAAADRALGGLLSGSVTPTFGASFTNNTGSIITSIDLAYIGEQWRIGAVDRVDRIDFQYSVNATSLITGTWTDVNTLDFTAPVNTGTAGALNGNLAANRTSISSSITGLSIAIGATFWIRWNDLNASGSDDGLSVDDLSLTPFTASSNTISTTAVATSPFVVTCNAAVGSVDFTSTGTFNSGNIYTAELSDAAGSFAAPVSIGSLSSTANIGTISVSIPGGTATGNGYRIRVVSNTPVTTGTDNGSNISITFNPCSITTGVVSGGPFAVDCSIGDAGSVAFNSSGTFAAGNTFTVQLSSAAGSFASPTTIGTITGASAEGLNPSGSINFTVPSATATGAGYLFRIVSSNPSITGTSSGANSITLSGGPCSLIAPYMTSVIINSCNVTCQEGNNEVIFGSTGGYSVLGNASNLILNYGNVPTPTTTYTDAFTAVSSTTTAINSAAGCTVVQDGLGEIMPPNSNFVITKSTICVDALDWTSLCGSNTIYIFYSTDASWQTSGNFVNTPNGLRYFRTAITSTDASVSTIDYSYNSDLLVNSDGEFVTYGANGGTPLFYGDNNCLLNPVLLPSTLVNFKGEVINGQSVLSWQTNSEQNNDYFTVAHSTTGYDFEVIGQIQGAGNSSTLNDYNLIHSRPAQGINYYKLTSTDYDGTNYTKEIVSLLFNSNGCYFDAQTSEIKFNERSDYRIFSMDGKLLGEVMNESSLLFNQQGIVLIQDLRTGLTERLFVP